MNTQQVKQLLEAKKRELSRNGSSKTSWIRPPSEANKKFTFRILPYTEEGDFTVLKYYHWGVGNELRVECTRTDDCPICQVLQKHRKTNWKKAQKYLPRGQAFFNVQIPEEPDNVYLLSLSESFLDWLITTMTEMGISDLFDPVKGRDIIIWRKSDKGAFEKMVSLKERPIADTKEDIDAVLEKTVNLDKFFKPLTDEDLLRMSILAQELDKEFRLSITPEDIAEDVAEEIDNAETIENITSEAKPKECFGNFNSSDKNCLLCEYSTDCMIKSA